jgi:surfactin family lipopeptide synthetase A
VSVSAPGLSDAKAALLQKYLRGELPQAVTNQRGIPPRPPGECVPLSFGQQQVWLLTQMAGDQPVYNECVTIGLTGPLDVPALERSFAEVIRRHEPWRTTFSLIDGEPVQVIHPVPAIRLPVVDLAALPEAEREAEALRLASIDARIIFDLARGPLVRSRLVKLSEAEYRLYLTLHHIIFDGVSIYDVLLPELAALYDAFSAGKSSSLAEPAIQYADYAHWQRQRVQGEYLTRHMAYWRQALGDLPMLQLPTDHPRPAVQTFRGALHRLSFPRSLSDDLKELSRREGVTLYMTLVAALVTLLHRYTGQDDIVIGTVTGSRERPEIEKLMGFFLNTIALRTDLAGDPTFREVLERVRTATLEVQEHRDVPFELVVRELHPQRNFAQNPLFQVMFTLEPPLAPLDVPWTMSQLDVDVGTAKFDLSVELDDRADGIIGRFEYSTDLFDADTIARMVGHFEALLRGIVADPGRPISELPLLSDAERRQALITWNDTDARYPRDRHVHELFEDQVARTPDAIAAVFDGEQIRYRVLDERANRLARHLQARGVGPDALVGLCVERSLDMLVALLAVLKAGGAYVPLDPAYPRERLAFMLEDARVRILLTEKRLLAKLPVHAAEVVCLDRDAEAIAAHAGETPVSAVTPENLAYVIYTSGSTGKPKGVMIPHRALVNLLLSMRGQLGITADDTLLAATSLSFDIAGLELYLPLLVGARVAIVPQEVAAHGRRFAALIEQSGATMMQATPTVWRALIDAGWQGSARLHILCGGEALPQELARQLLLAGRRLTNLYGPTETTIWSTLHEVTDAERPVPLGHPIANTQVFILDRHGLPMPVGVPGELHIGGDGLARGYLHRPELTEQRFRTARFPEAGSARLYATGDLARYLPDGAIEYLGRIDQQVKVRGFRIELGEIETLLERCPGVRQATVIVREDEPGNAVLVAYVVPDQSPAPTVGDLRHALVEQLPAYMAPSAIIMLDAMPVTPNGKVDRRMLPAPSSMGSARDVSFAPPKTLLQLQLAQIWEEILDVRPIGITDDFFELGGHSLLAARLVDRIADVCGQTLPLASLFAGATIEHLEEALLQRQGDGPFPPVVQVQEGNAKQPFFFLHGDLRDGGVYCIKLARALDPDRPFYAIHPAGTNGRPVPHTLEAIAADHLDALRAVQPEGPYLLGGFCAGGHVAFELARQLQARGERVDALAIIELGIVSPHTRVACVLVERLGNLVGLDAETQARLFLRLRSNFAEKSPRALARDGVAAIAAIGAAVGRNLTVRLRQFRSGSHQGQPSPSRPIHRARGPQRTTAFELEGRYMWAIMRYAPRRYRGRVALFWARDEHVEPARDLSKGWKEIVGEIDVYSTPGTHFSAITTHVEPLSEHLSVWLNSGEETRTNGDLADDI